MRKESTWIWFLLSFTIIVFFASLSQTGCTEVHSDPVTANAEFGSSDQGGTEPIIHMPFASGKSPQCVQGAFGTFSHNAVSTKYDIDFDTSNTADEELFSPVSGVVSVHTEDASKNFGNHVCIDLGNGYYVILGHLKDIFVQNGQQVAAGQLIGHEGCTGYCSGDHVHVGLHKGDAKQMGQLGVSVPVSYMLADKTSGSSSKAVLDSSLVCGLKALGDQVDGHFYTSILPVALWHPEGTLIKSPSSPKVYLVQEGETAAWIADEKAFTSHGYLFSKVVTVSEKEISCYGQARTIDGAGSIDAVYDASNKLWLLVGAKNAPNRFRKPMLATAWPIVLQSWGLAYTEQNPPQHISQAISLDNWPVAAGSVSLRDGTLVKETSYAEVYAIAGGVASPISDWDTFLFLGYRQNQILTIPDGSIALIQDVVGNCSASLWCLQKSMITACGGNGFHTQKGDARDVPISISSTGAPDSAAFNEPDAGSTDSTSSLPAAKEIVETSPPKPNGDSAKDDLWLNDYGLDGTQETLMLHDDRWLDANLVGKDAFVYGTGGCFDTVLTEEDRVKASYGYYDIDFSKFETPCDGELTLISTIGTDGQPPNANMSNWNWWQNAPFCSTGSAFCELKKNNTSWEEWLLRVSWNPLDGLQPDGNGFTKNAQLN